MAKKGSKRPNKPAYEAPRAAVAEALKPPAGCPSSLLDTRVSYCGDCLEQLQKLPQQCIDLVYISQIRRGGHPPFNSNRTVENLGEVFWGETKEWRAFEDRHGSTQAYPGAPGRPRCVELARVLKKTGSFYYNCDWHTSHHVKVMLDEPSSTREKLCGQSPQLDGPDGARLTNGRE